MNPVAIALFCAFGLFFFSRHLQHQRRSWLRRLGLPGRWQLLPAMPDDADLGAASAAKEPVANLEIAGELSNGTYRWLDPADGHVLEAGRWRLSGHRLRLHAKGAAAPSRQFDVRLLQPTEVGLFEPSTKCYWLLSRGHSNVVNLPRREQKR